MPLVNKKKKKKTSTCNNFEEITRLKVWFDPENNSRQVLSVINSF